MQTSRALLAQALRGLSVTVSHDAMHSAVCCLSVCPSVSPRYSARTVKAYRRKSFYYAINLILTELKQGWNCRGWGHVMSTDAHFWVKIGFKFQSLGKISNISAADPPVLLGQFQHWAKACYLLRGHPQVPPQGRQIQVGSQTWT